MEWFTQFHMVVDEICFDSVLETKRTVLSPFRERVPKLLTRKGWICRPLPDV